MKKSSLFISAILTTFVLVVLAGAIGGYRALAASNVPEPTAFVQATLPQQVTEQPTVQETEASPTETATTQWLNPQQGAQLAAMYLGRNDLYSVEMDSMYGQNVYKVTFSSGDVAYVSMDGQIFRVDVAAAQVAQSAAQTSSSSQPVNYEHEGGDDD